MEQNAIQMGKNSLAEAEFLLKNKNPLSTWGEHYFLADEEWKKVKNLPQPLQMGKGLYGVLDRCSLPISENDLLLGRFVEKVLDEKEEARFQALLKANRLDENPIFVYNGGHLTLDLETPCKLGISGLIEKTKIRIEKAKADKESKNCLNFLNGMLWIYKAIKNYIFRYGNEAKKQGKNQMVEVCEHLLVSPCKTFREHLQLKMFLFIVYMAYAGSKVACLNIGRLDDELLEVYLADLQSGILTKETAGALLDDFYAKCSLHLGRGEHQLSNMEESKFHTGWDRNPTFDSPSYITLGGVSARYKKEFNPLTLLAVEHIVPALKNPVIVFRYFNGIDDRIFTALSKKMAKNASVLLYNDEVLIPAYLHIGVKETDAKNYTVHPCNWADIGAKSAIVGSVGGFLPEYLLKTLNKKENYSSFEELLNEFVLDYENSLKEPFASYRAQGFLSGKRPSRGLLSIDDCLIPGPLENARNKCDGGIEYPCFYVLLRNIGTCADMLASIDLLVFKQKKCTFAELMQACKDNFVGHEELLKLCKNAPKYGHDDEIGDAYAIRVLNLLLDAIDKEATNENGVRDVYTLNVTINDMNHLGLGARLQATPDGRLAGKPVSENLSPTVGHPEGATALLNSVAKLPYNRIHSGALNLRLRKENVKDEARLACFKALLLAYLENGGMQVQVSIADTKDLYEAQKCPECYKDLTVRITGYSAVFVDMSEKAQNEIIRRDEQN